mmetsp:Transcript_4519/g.9822  ORF Transcript_4519/g.9822 Transcript_4519/m.9822 type:complete len:435 (-) Transcript_4519:172-1476(-)
MNLPVLFLGEDCREIIIHVFSETCVDAAAATRIVATEIAIETAGVPVHRHHRVVVVVATATSTGGSDKKDLSKGANDFQPTAAVDGVVAVANHHVQRRQRRPIHSSSISSSSILANTHIHGNNTADNIRDHKVEPPEFAVANGRVSVFPAGTSTTSTTTVGSGTTSTTGTTKNHQEAEHDLQTIRGPIQVVDQCDGRIAIAAAAAAVVVGVDTDASFDTIHATNANSSVIHFIYAIVVVTVVIAHKRHHTRQELAARHLYAEIRWELPECFHHRIEAPRTVNLVPDGRRDAVAGSNSCCRSMCVCVVAGGGFGSLCFFPIAVVWIRTQQLSQDLARSDHDRDHSFIVPPMEDEIVAAVVVQDVRVGVHSARVVVVVVVIAVETIILVPMTMIITITMLVLNKLVHSSLCLRLSWSSLCRKGREKIREHPMAPGV